MSDAIAAADEPQDSSVDDVAQVVGVRVREIRTSRALTMQQFATQAGISRAMLFKIEHGQAAASIATLAKVAKAAEVPVTALFRGLDEEHDALHIPAGAGYDIIHEGSGPGRRYQDLGTLRGPVRELEPVLISITEPDEVFPLFQHAAPEMLYIVEGTMEYAYGSKTYTLGAGDTFHMRGEVSHGPVKMIDLPVRFLSLKIHSVPSAGPG